MAEGEQESSGAQQPNLSIEYLLSSVSLPHVGDDILRAEARSRRVTEGMRYLLYPAVVVSLVICFGSLPLAWLADSMAFQGPRPAVGPWTLLVLMAGPLLFSAAFSLAVVRLPMLAPARS